MQFARSSSKALRLCCYDYESVCFIVIVLRGGIAMNERSLIWIIFVKYKIMNTTKGQL